MTVCYIEVDDEITGAISRIRAVKDGEAVIVLPHGSRIATSRINFRLLAREGTERRLNLVAVSDEPSVRALAVSAGLPAYDTLVAAQQALANFRDQDRRLAERIGPSEEDAATSAAATGAAAASGASAVRSGTSPRAATADALEKTVVMPVSPQSAEDFSALPRSRRREPGTDAAGRRRRFRWAPLVAAGLLLLLIAGVGYGAYLFLPTATVTLQPLTSTLTTGPITVVADPDAAVTDVAAGVVPAQRLEIPLSVTDEFRATGRQVQETRATGTVRFRSENTLNEVSVLEGTVVSTADGIDFETIQAASVPRADFTTGTPGTIDVPVRAVRAGLRGNVSADMITEVPQGLAGQLVSVRNPDPIAGGTRVEERVVQQSDYDKAVIQMDSELELALAAELNDPQNTPRGLTLFPVTAQTGDTQTNPTSPEIVGTPADTFSLTMSSTATVTAVNQALVEELADTRLRGLLQPGQHLVNDAVDATIGPGEVEGESVAYQVTPTASVFTDPDRAALAAAVRGKSIPEARSILEPYGMVDISMWPEFVDRLPDQTARISLVVVTPSPAP
jgi:Baseplate J-like protein